PAALRTDDGMAAVGRLLRMVADAAATFVPPADAVWRTGPVRWEPGQVVAHGDVGHGTLVWRDDGTPALFDWEFAHPAPPLHDLAGAAAWLVPLVDFDHERRGFGRVPDRGARLRALAGGAGVDVSELLDAVSAALRFERGRVAELGGLGIRPFDDYLAAGQIEGFDRALAWLREHGTTLH
ncbi:MAG TPA: phosphotransferase, partial [Egicoccus sp.]